MNKGNSGKSVHQKTRRNETGKKRSMWRKGDQRKALKDSRKRRNGKEVVCGEHVEK